MLVRFQADVREQRAAHARCVAGGAVAGSGAGVAFGGHCAGRSYYRREVGKIETALAGLLDRLEHRPRTVIEASRLGS